MKKIIKENWRRCLIWLCIYGLVFMGGLRLPVFIINFKQVDKEVKFSGIVLKEEDPAQAFIYITPYESTMFMRKDGYTSSRILNIDTDVSAQDLQEKYGDLGVVEKLLPDGTFYEVTVKMDAEGDLKWEKKGDLQWAQTGDLSWEQKDDLNYAYCIVALDDASRGTLFDYLFGKYSKAKYFVAEKASYE